MNLNGYRLYPHHWGSGGGQSVILESPDGDILLMTEDVGLDTLMRLALEHDLKRRALDATP